MCSIDHILTWRPVPVLKRIHLSMFYFSLLSKSMSEMHQCIIPLKRRRLPCWPKCFVSITGHQSWSQYKPVTTIESFDAGMDLDCTLSRNDKSQLLLGVCCLLAVVFHCWVSHQLCDGLYCASQSQRSQTEAVTFLANHDDSRALYAIPGIHTDPDWSGHTGFGLVTNILTKWYHWWVLIYFISQFLMGLSFQTKHLDSWFLKRSRVDSDPSISYS